MPIIRPISENELLSLTAGDHVLIDVAGAKVCCNATQKAQSPKLWTTGGGPVYSDVQYIIGVSTGFSMFKPVFYRPTGECDPHLYVIVPTEEEIRCVVASFALVSKAVASEPQIVYARIREHFHDGKPKMWQNGLECAQVYNRLKEMCDSYAETFAEEAPV